MTLPLVGGYTGRTSPYGYHDWEFILKETGLIHSAHTLASLTYFLGIVLMILSLLWGGYILLWHFKNLKHQS